MKDSKTKSGMVPIYDTENARYSLDTERTDMDSLSEAELRATAEFLESIEEELFEMGDSGSVDVDWENKTITAYTADGQSKSYDFSNITDRMTKYQN